MYSARQYSQNYIKYIDRQIQRVGSNIPLDTFQVISDRALYTPAEVRHSPCLLSFPFQSLPLLPPLPLEVGPLIQLRGLGERCEPPSGVRGRTPATNAFVGHFEPRKRVWWQQDSSFCSSVGPKVYIKYSS